MVCGSQWLCAAIRIPIFAARWTSNCKPALRALKDMRAFLAMSMTLLLLACGDDDGEADAGSSADASSPSADAADPGDPDAGAADAAPSADAAPTGGTATIDGTLNEETVEPAGAWYGLHPLAAGFVLAMPEADVTCDFESRPEGLIAVVGFPCGPAEAVTYPVAADPEAPCDPEAPHVWLLVEGFDFSGGGSSEFLAASGSVTIRSAGEASIAGRFDADFGADGALTGSFDASVCPRGSIGATMGP